jgi:peptide/nickel transport system permease protein
MQTYILRRTLQAIPLLLILSILLFFLVRIAPGGPLSQAARNPNVSREQLQALRVRLGLDQPLYVQYFHWLRAIVVEGDLGQSIKSNRPVATMIGERIPNTLLLVGLAFGLTLLIALPIGAISAQKPYSLFDYTVTTFTFAGQSVPIYWMGLMLILVFYVWLDNPFTGQPFLPAGGMYSAGGEKTLGDLAWHLILPVGALCLTWVAWYSRFFRASMLEVLHADYIRTARGKGLAERTVTYVHALRNGIMPLVTMIALDFPAMFAGALFVETIFSWPGMGRLFWEAARGRDYPVLLGVILINAVLIVLCNIVADLVYGLVDPRVRYE